VQKHMKISKTRLLVENLAMLPLKHKTTDLPVTIKGTEALFINLYAVNSLSIATRLRAGRLGFESQLGLGMFLFATSGSRPPPVVPPPPQPPIQWVPGDVSPGVKRLSREADHSPPSSTEVKNAWCHISPHPYIFMAWCLVKYRICLQGVVLF
jgi:hypothetical protein